METASARSMDSNKCYNPPRLRHRRAWRRCTLQAGEELGFRNQPRLPMIFSCTRPCCLYLHEVVKSRKKKNRGRKINYHLYEMKHFLLRWNFFARTAAKGLKVLFGAQSLICRSRSATQVHNSILSVYKYRIANIGNAFFFLYP